MLNKKIFFFFLLFLFCVEVQAFNPRNKEVFKKNCLRLLKNSEYKLLEAYFLNYFLHISPKWSAELTKKGKIFKESYYVFTLAKEIPDPEIKKKIIHHALEINPAIEKLHCYLAEQWLSEKKYPLAKKHFHLCPKEEKIFYLAQIAQTQNKKQQAIKYLKELLKEKPKKNLQSEAFIALAKLYIDLERYQESIKFAKKAKKGIARSIVLYKAYHYNGNPNLAKKEMHKIKEKYIFTLESKAFLSQWDED